MAVCCNPAAVFRHYGFNGRVGTSNDFLVCHPKFLEGDLYRKMALGPLNKMIKLLGKTE
jgi:hypothetical protein